MTSSALLHVAAAKDQLVQILLKLNVMKFMKMSMVTIVLKVELQYGLIPPQIS